MSILARPTFHESWYRVAGLKVALRATAQISRQHYRGERWYVVRDPAGNQFHRLSDAAYRFVALLDGSRTVQEAWDLCGGVLADDAPTQPEVIQILSQLYAANLVAADVTPDSAVLLRRSKTQKKRQFQNRLMQTLFPRIPLWDPDRFLRTWMPVMRVALSKLGVAVWLAVVLTAVVLVAPHGKELAEEAARATAIAQNPENAFYLYAVFVVIKLIHELGHAFTCRRFGGEVHELGVMFLVFIPTPYVDASSAWAFSSKWQRILVGAGGMIFELFVAAIAAFVWLATKDSQSLTSQLAYNTMLIASVTTVVFNANPLLRYDGYYILSDWLEIPNLQQKSREYALGLVQRHVFRAKLKQPLPPGGQRVILFLYSIASSIYRLFVGLTIVLLVWRQVPVLGALMSLGALFAWLVMPVGKVAKYLLLDPELHRKRGPAIAVTVLFVGVVVFLVGFVPMPVRFRATGVVQPAEGRQVTVYSREEGFVKWVAGPDGRRVTKGEKILEMENPYRTLELEVARIKLAKAQIQLRAALDQSDGQAPVLRNEVLRREGEVKYAQERVEQLTVYAPADGELIAPGVKGLPGQFLRRGQEFARVAAFDKLMVAALVEKKEEELAVSRGGMTVEVRMAGNLGRVYSMPAYKVIPADQTLPSAALSVAAGETIALDANDRTGRKAATDYFGLEVPLPEGERYLPGQRAYVRCTLNEKRSLGWQGVRWVLQLLQTSGGSKLAE